MQNGKDGLKEALDKKAAYGPDIDLDHYELGSFEPHEIDDLEKADEATMRKVVTERSCSSITP